MDSSALGYFMRKCDSYGLGLDQITIKGKETETISATLTLSHLGILEEMCIDNQWTFHTTQDTFLSKRKGRVQIHLDGRASP